MCCSLFSSVDDGHTVSSTALSLLGFYLWEVGQSAGQQYLFFLRLKWSFANPYDYAQLCCLEHCHNLA